MGRRSAETQPVQRRETLQRAEVVGAAQAARETGISASTIRAWRHRATRSESKLGGVAADGRSGADADRLRQVVDAATRRALTLTRKGEMLAAQRAITTADRASEQAAQLEEAAGRAAEREARITEENAATLAAVVEAFLEAVGCDGDPVRGLLAGLLRLASLGQPVEADQEAADAARVFVRARFEPEIRRLLQAERRDAERRAGERPGWAAPLALPAAGETEVRELERLAAPRHAVRVFADRQADEADEAEVVGGEVVPDEDVRYANGRLRVIEPRNPRGFVPRRESRNRL